MEYLGIVRTQQLTSPEIAAERIEAQVSRQDLRGDWHDLPQINNSFVDNDVSGVT